MVQSGGRSRLARDADGQIVHTVAADRALVIADARLDARFADNPLVVGPPFMRGYAGAPLRAPLPGSAATVAIGALCVSDNQPRQFHEDDIRLLRDLARVVEARVKTAQLERQAIERDALLSQLQRKDMHFNQAARMANVGSWRLNLSDAAIEWSDTVFEIYGLPSGPSPDVDTALAYYPQGDRERIATAVRSACRTVEPFNLEADFVAADGVLKRVRNLGEWEMYEGRPIALFGIVQDITASYALGKALELLANVDSLTGIGSRAACDSAIEQAITRARREQSKLALVLNDGCGHLAGDEYLQFVGAKLRAAHLADCFVGRFGGDEFVVVVSSPKDCVRLDDIVRTFDSDLQREFPHPQVAI